MEEILVSIDCITYNHEKYIRKAIEGFLMQKTNFKYEILIHDDASTDKTQDIIIEYQKQYPDLIKPILQKENQYSKGGKVSYRFNVSRAKGKYIAICEGDDYWTDPNKLQKQVDYMENNPDCGMCFHAFKMESDNKIINEIRVYNKNCISSTDDIILGDGGFISTNTILYRRNLMENPPDFYLECSVGDYPLQIYTSMNKYAYYLNESMSVYRYLSENSWTKKMETDADSKEKIVRHRKNIIKLLNDINEYTEFRYNKSINKKTLLLEMDVYLLRGDLKKIKDLKNSNRKIYKEVFGTLSPKEKIKYGVPIFYIILRKFKWIKHNILMRIK
ncbi:glycosyltransferase [Clostridium sp.]|uniref:glycosyltransferase family 2 protein n=1 Tax=Clostridium sp. TaxID=1506 RepID=UPI00291503E4|nr:glycosyltransferase [Clostridium sp.]MDU5107880.1 glycosyltransferase [Clostridium sp.]